ncbi:unnamed protein product, partial [Discosporangium mesarthrocarpum]
IVESGHPYENELNSHFPIRIPGASAIEEISDPRSRIEEGNDYVVIYAS